LGALVPAVALAQTATPVKADSAAAAAAAATHTAAGKRSRLSALGHAAASKANGAADKVSQTTGVSKETMAKAALASTGVGAAAMLVHPDSSGLASNLTANVAATAGRSVMQRIRDARAAKVGAPAAAGSAVPNAGATMPASAMTAQQMALYRQQMAMAQAQAAAQAGQLPAGAMMGNSAEMQQLQAEYTQIAMRASAGDKVAAQQLTRFSQEWTGAVMRLQGVAPAQQQGAYEAALRDALTCAVKGKSCKS
jgi:hypothetical protein